MTSVKALQYFSLKAPILPFIQATKGLTAEDQPLVEQLWRLVKPSVYWRDGLITTKNQQQLIIDNGELIIDSCYLAQGLAQCQRLTVLCVTIGHQLPQQAENDLLSGHLHRGTVSDLLGSYSAEYLAETFSRYLAIQNMTKRLYPTLRYSAGYGDWSLSAQKQLLDFLAHPLLTVTCNDNFLLNPVKSITAVIGWSSNYQPPSYPQGKHTGFCNGGHNCAACTTWACQKGGQK